MHELSIVRALIRLVEEHRPTGARVRKICVQAGPLQAIEPTALDWAWQAARIGTPCAEAALELVSSPWTLQCAACGRRWQSETLDQHCRCSADAARIVGGDELLLTLLDVDDARSEPETLQDTSRVESSTV